MLIWLLTIVLSIYPLAGQGPASGFEGQIAVRRVSVYDTTFYSLKVKNHKVRIDEHCTRHSNDNYFLIDLHKCKTLVVNQEMQAFKVLESSKQAKLPDSELKVTKTSNYKQINGYTCYQWRIRHEAANLELVYWVTKAPFDYASTLFCHFGDLKQYGKFFERIPGSSGYIPILLEERTLTRQLKASVQIESIQSKPVDRILFSIPDNFTNL
jgi:hypothetical protein